jgi:outer membrane lipoprotein-sorting protein
LVTRTTGLTAAALGLFSLSALTPVFAQDAKTILTRVNKAYAGIKTYQADMLMDINTPQGKMTMTSVMKKSGEKMAMKMTGKGGNAPAGALNMDMVVDGKNMYMYMGMMNQYMKMPLTPQMKTMMKQQGSSPDQIVKMVQSGSVKKLADSSVDGKPVYVLEAKQATPQGSSTSKLYIDKATYRMRRMDGINPGMAGMGGGGGNVTVTVRNEKINPPIPASAFVFNPPKGAKEMKMPQGGAPGGGRP